MTKTWCKHIKWKPWERKWWVFQGEIHVDRGWRYCPICKAERPSKKKTTTEIIERLTI